MHAVVNDYKNCKLKIITQLVRKPGPWTWQLYTAVQT